MGAERGEQRKPLLKNQGPIGRTRYVVDFSLAVGRMFCSVAREGYNSPYIITGASFKSEAKIAQ